MQRLGLLCVAMVLGAMGSRAGAEGFAWRNDLNAARAEAQQSGKLLLVHFWTDGCMPCARLERDVFSQPLVASAVETKYVPVKLNANDHPEVAAALGITRVPTDVVVTTEGKVLDRFVSPASPMAYVAKMTEIASAQQAKPGSAYDAVVAAQTGRPPLSSAPTSAAASNFAAPPMATSTQPPAAAKAAAPTTVTNPAAIAAVAPTAGGPTSAAAPQQVENRYATAPTAPAAQPAATATADVIQLPPGAAPMAFDGYCPVTMKREWRWARGDARYGLEHRGRTYLFATAADRDEFWKNPDAYSPVFSGDDPVLVIDQKKSTPGERRYALQFQDQFYFFSSEETLKKFRDNPAAYAQGVRQAMSQPAATAPGTQVR